MLLILVANITFLIADLILLDFMVVVSNFNSSKSINTGTKSNADTSIKAEIFHGYFCDLNTPISAFYLNFIDIINWLRSNKSLIHSSTYCFKLLI